MRITGDKYGKQLTVVGTIMYPEDFQNLIPRNTRGCLQMAKETVCM